jgi:hypothetical protein
MGRREFQHSGITATKRATPKGSSLKQFTKMSNNYKLFPKRHHFCVYGGGGGGGGGDGGGGSGGRIK